MPSNFSTMRLAASMSGRSRATISRVFALISLIFLLAFLHMTTQVQLQFSLVLGNDSIRAFLKRTLLLILVLQQSRPDSLAFHHPTIWLRSASASAHPPSLSAI